MAKPQPKAPAHTAAAPAIETDKPLPSTAAAVSVEGDTASRLAATSFAYEIEEGIPLPVKKTGVRGESRYPFATMPVNASFFVPASPEMEEPWKTLTSLASRRTRELFPKKFVTERQEKNGVSGVRIWRAPDNTEPLPEPKPRKKKEAAAPATPAAA